MTAPELILPTDNELGVPCLAPAPALQHAPQVTAPVLAWGSVRRTANASTWCFYVDDYRFEALWRDPLSPMRAGARELVEVNYTVHDDTPRAAAIWATYRKRYISRLWQDAGAIVWVDLCVSRQHADLVLLGVPEGWQRYATAGWDCRVSDLDEELETAVRHSAGAPFTGTASALRLGHEHPCTRQVAAHRLRCPPHLAPVRHPSPQEPALMALDRGHWGWATSMRLELALGRLQRRVRGLSCGGHLSHGELPCHVSVHPGATTATEPR